ncbi:hypothetical protein OPV22_024819 [Ensete ventricosum]|uniref:Uncharacterized protein n=1 Tax=Ensete ventricosum TaxID=4639 RepID=A0AAV8P6S5_ENSVE|nr:hypothetical protein OPV22_024819 [Ensete ventricosum]
MPCPPLLTESLYNQPELANICVQSKQESVNQYQIISIRCSSPKQNIKHLVVIKTSLLPNEALGFNVCMVDQ